MPPHDLNQGEWVLPSQLHQLPSSKKALNCLKAASSHVGETGLGSLLVQLEGKKMGKGRLRGSEVQNGGWGITVTRCPGS